MRNVQIQQDDFDALAAARALTDANLQVGAVVTFTGVVRSDDGLSGLMIEHYPGMTEREISYHIDEAERRWPILGVTVIHRIGRLVPGENIVLVVVASAHRQAAFSAAEFLIDYLKTRAPFWKQEERGTSTIWIEAKESDAAATARWDPS